jgi:Zn-dependent protease
MVGRSPIDMSLPPCGEGVGDGGVGWRPADWPHLGALNGAPESHPHPLPPPRKGEGLIPAAPADVETPATSQTVSPWGPPNPPPAPAPPPAQPSRVSEFVWGLISTLLLAAWVAWQMNWVWGTAVILGLFVHEFGHVLVINWAGSGPSRIRIIPFLGGAATMTRPPDSQIKGVLIALSGPVFGLIAALPFFVLAERTGQAIWEGGAFVIAALNLLNLAPAPPLDGSKALGPLLARIHPALERGALAIVGVLAVAWTFSRGSIIVPLFISLSVMASLRRGLGRPPSRPFTWSEWLLGLALYALALALCAAVAVVAAQGAHINSRFFSFGGVR